MRWAKIWVDGRITHPPPDCGRTLSNKMATYENLNFTTDQVKNT